MLVCTSIGHCVYMYYNVILGQTDATERQSYSADEWNSQWHQSDQVLCIGEPLSGRCIGCQNQRCHS